MHSIQRHIAGNARSVLCAVIILALLAPCSVRAHRSAHPEDTAPEVRLVCLESDGAALVLRPFVVPFSAAEQPMSAMYADPHRQSETTLRVELQIPEALLQGLLWEEMTNGRSELPGPEALLIPLFAEGEVQLLSRGHRQ